MRGSKIGYDLFDQEFVLWNWPPLLLGAITFLHLVHFCQFCSAMNVPSGELHLLFKHHKQWDPPTKTTNKLYLKCSVIDWCTLIPNPSPCWERPLCFDSRIWFVPLPLNDPLWVLIFWLRHGSSLAPSF